MGPISMRGVFSALKRWGTDPFINSCENVENTIEFIEEMMIAAGPL
jgi:hypothetical protein